MQAVMKKSYLSDYTEDNPIYVKKWSDETYRAYVLKRRISAATWNNEHDFVCIDDHTHKIDAEWLRQMSPDGNVTYSGFETKLFADEAVLDVELLTMVVKCSGKTYPIHTLLNRSIGTSTSLGYLLANISLSAYGESPEQIPDDRELITLKCAPAALNVWHTDPRLYGELLRMLSDLVLFDAMSPSDANDSLRQFCCYDTSASQETLFLDPCHHSSAIPQQIRTA